MAFDDREMAIVKGMVDRGDKQQDVAAYFGVNQARVNDIAKGKKGIEIKPAPSAELPPPGPYLVGRSALKARDTLLALRDLIDETIAEIHLYEKKRD